MTKKFFYYQFPWLLLMLLIFVQSSIGRQILPEIKFDLADKILHFIVFGMLGILTARGLKNSDNKLLNQNWFSFSIYICILYGASDEIHQYFVPGRHASWGDWIADILGIVIMIWLYKHTVEKKKLKHEEL
jgi:VanZ family protein